MNIGSASKASGVSQRMIRHYEEIGLKPPAARRDSGYRDYSEADVNRRGSSPMPAGSEEPFSLSSSPVARRAV
jgi:hypothetical protein